MSTFRVPIEKVFRCVVYVDAEDKFDAAQKVKSFCDKGVDVDDEFWDNFEPVYYGDLRVFDELACSINEADFYSGNTATYNLNGRV